MKRYLILFLILISGSLLFSCAQTPADIILANGEIYTMEEDNPWASSIVITDNKITAVLSESESYDNYVGDRTRVIDLNGRFVTPGIIDGHTHFNGYGAQINGVDLLTVSDNDGLKTELRRVVNILGDDEWITGGLWGGYEEWAFGAAEAGKKKRGRWEPDRWAIDEITENNPCLLSSFDRKLFLANTLALEAAGLDNERLEGMKLDRRRHPTGLIYAGSPALKRIRDVVKPKSEERILDEMRAGMKALAEQGITEIHDITPVGQEMRYVKLEESSELTCRVWMRPDLSRGAELKDAGLTMGVHPVTKQKNDYLRFGALKGYIDGIMGTHGALFFEPYSDQPENSGHYRRHTSDDPDLMVPNMEKMYDYIKVGYEAGFVSNVHAIGTKGVALMLDTYERLMTDLGKDLEGFRVIHAQVIRDQDFPRFKALNVIAEVNPYHVSDDMRWMEERIGTERCKGAYAFKRLIDNGAVLSFGSDIPGTSAAKYLCHPKYLIHAAVNRTTLNGEPEGGWFSQEKISVHEALKAFTINNAYAAFADDIRGSLKEGKLADITIFDKNMIRMDPKDILTTEVDMTIVDGRIVFERK